MQRKTKLGKDAAEAQAAALVKAQQEGAGALEDADAGMPQGAVGVVTGIDRLKRR